LFDEEAEPDRLPAVFDVLVFLDAAFLPDEVLLRVVPDADDERFTAAVLPFFAAMNTSLHKELTND
jgi:hypothetical protein